VLVDVPPAAAQRRINPNAVAALAAHVAVGCAGGGIDMLVPAVQPRWLLLLAAWVVVGVPLLLLLRRYRYRRHCC